jgi:hypothetical protein
LRRRNIWRTVVGQRALGNTSGGGSLWHPVQIVRRSSSPRATVDWLDAP